MSANPTIGALPRGGTVAQVLTKQTPVDGDVAWTDPPNTPGGAAGGDLAGTYPNPTVAGRVKTTGGGVEDVNTQATATGATTLNLSNGNLFDLTLTGNITLTVSNATAGKACSFTLIARQDGTGSRTITWQSGVKWAGGTAPTISTAASKVDVFTFLSVDGGTTWLGFSAGIDLR